MLSNGQASKQHLQTGVQKKLGFSNVGYKVSSAIAKRSFLTIISRKNSTALTHHHPTHVHTQYSKNKEALQPLRS